MPGRDRPVVVPAAADQRDEPALRYAVSWARTAGSPLVVVYVATAGLPLAIAPEAAGQLGTWQYEYEQAALARSRELLGPRSGGWELVSRSGPVLATVLTVAAEHRALAVVIGRHRASLAWRILGGPLRRIRGGVPVLVVPDQVTTAPDPTDLADPVCRALPRRRPIRIRRRTL